MSCLLEGDGLRFWRLSQTLSDIALVLPHAAECPILQCRWTGQGKISRCWMSFMRGRSCRQTRDRKLSLSSRLKKAMIWSHHTGPRLRCFESFATVHALKIVVQAADNPNWNNQLDHASLLKSQNLWLWSVKACSLSWHNAEFVNTNAIQAFRKSHHTTQAF